MAESQRPVEPRVPSSGPSAPLRPDAGTEGYTPQRRLSVMREVVDAQLRTVDDRRIGRVADVLGEVRDDGSLWLTHLVIGPEALIGRVSRRLHPLATRLLKGRFEYYIPVDEIDEIGPTVWLRGRAEEYPIGRTDGWVTDHILRWIPGSGRERPNDGNGTARRPQPKRPAPVEDRPDRLHVETLIGSRVLTSAGDSIGNVTDIEARYSDGFQVVDLELGRHGLLDRLNLLRPLARRYGSKKPRTVDWSDVAEHGTRKITLRAGASVPEG